jgi:hypothetical protein
MGLNARSARVRREEEGEEGGGMRWGVAAAAAATVYVSSLLESCPHSHQTSLQLCQCHT